MFGEGDYPLRFPLHLDFFEINPGVRPMAFLLKGLVFRKRWCGCVFKFFAYL